MKKTISVILLISLILSLVLLMLSCDLRATTYAYGTVEEIGDSHLILNSANNDTKYQVNFSQNGTKVLHNGEEVTLDQIQVGSTIVVGFNGAVKVDADKNMQIDALTITIKD